MITRLILAPYTNTTLTKPLRHEKECGDDENGPRRRQTRRLGPLVSFFSLSVFFHTNIVYIDRNIRQVAMRKVATTRTGPNNVLRRLGPLVSFFLSFCVLLLKIVIFRFH
jgi:hypothetical protein